ncbi:MAG: c-type cytochrome [Syntrophobacteraceae bacterium]
MQVKSMIELPPKAVDRLAGGPTARLILSTLVLVSVLAAGGVALAADGAEIFATLKCSMCHKPDKKAAAISLAEIVQTYSDKAKLVKFFKGEIKPLIESEKWGMMRPQLEKIKALPDQDKEALADYILSFK